MLAMRGSKYVHIFIQSTWSVAKIIKTQDMRFLPTYKDGSLIPLVITNNVFVHHCELAAWVEAGHPDFVWLAHSSCHHKQYTANWQHELKPATRTHSSPPPNPTQYLPNFHPPYTIHMFNIMPRLLPPHIPHKQEQEQSWIGVIDEQERERERNGRGGTDATIREQASGSANATIN